ncbi:MAG: hypothetical protein M3P85_01775 [Actinomycetota bacterium]|nr:hypothetical protein [Actinomycetota bacterium]
MGSARRSFRVETVRGKLVDNSHSRSAATKAGRSSSGPRRPTSNRAWGMERPREPVWIRISSIMRGQAFRASNRRRSRRAR